MWLIYHHCTDLLCFRKYFHWVKKQENISNDPKITKIGQGFAEGDPSWTVHGVGSHLWTPSWIWKMPKFKVNLPSRLFVLHRYSYKSNQAVPIHWCVFCHFHDDFHWWVPPKSFTIQISPWYMLFMVPNVFPLKPGHKQTYIKTQRPQTSVKGLRKEVHHCESLKLAAILDAILDFEKCSRVSSIHQADFVYVMSEAAESSEKKTISVRSGYAHLAAWLNGGYMHQ